MLDGEEVQIDILDTAGQENYAGSFDRSLSELVSTNDSVSSQLFVIPTFVVEKVFCLSSM